LQLLESMTSHMVEARSRLHRGNAVFADTSQLLLIVSDGHCLGDRCRVKAAVRRAQDAQIFLVFVVLANPNKEVCFLYLYCYNFSLLMSLLIFLSVKCQSISRSSVESYVLSVSQSRKYFNMHLKQMCSQLRVPHETRNIIKMAKN